MYKPQSILALNPAVLSSTGLHIVIAVAMILIRADSPVQIVLEFAMSRLGIPPEISGKYLP